MKVMVAGDWHRDGKWAAEAVRAAAHAGAGAIVHVGDLGAFWGTESRPELGLHGFTAELAAAVAEAGIPFYFVDGNHEDHDALARLPRSAGGLAEQDGIVYLPRGSRLELGGAGLRRPRRRLQYRPGVADGGRGLVAAGGDRAP